MPTEGEGGATAKKIGQLDIFAAVAVSAWFIAMCAGHAVIGFVLLAMWLVLKICALLWPEK